MKRALIHIASKQIVQVEPPGGEFAIHEDYTWVDCPDETAAYSWTYDGTAFNPPPGPSLASLKAAKRTQIEHERDAACYANVNVLGHVWQADPRSQSLMATAILLAQAGVYTPSVWRTADNVDVPITLQALVTISGSIAAQTQAAYAASWARKQALEAATTAAEVEAV